MKKLLVLQIVRAFGAAGIGDLIAAGSAWGDSFGPGDLVMVEELVFEGLVVRGGDGRLRLPKAKSVPVGDMDLDGKGDEVLHYFSDSKEFSWSQVAKAISVEKPVAKAVCEKLIAGGSIKVKRTGRHFGHSFPWMVVA